MEAPLYNNKAEKIGTVQLPDSVFGVRWNEALVHQAVVAQEANRRLSVADTKDRGEVRGGGKKPWRQKGTGRARHGSIRSPLWKGGGVTFGPKTDKNHSLKINKKMKRKAIFVVLSKRAKLEDVKFIDSLGSFEKTKQSSHLLNSFFPDKKYNCLLVPAAHDIKRVRAVNNVPKVRVLNADSLNVEDLLKYKRILIEKDAVDIITKRYSL